MGLAIGDALGMPFEGKERKYIQGKWDGVSFLSRKGLLPGEWTDDTEMALIHAESLIKCGKVDVEDLSLRFVRWLESGKAVTQGIGKTTREAEPGSKGPGKHQGSRSRKGTDRDGIA